MLTKSINNTHYNKHPIIETSRRRRGSLKAAAFLEHIELAKQNKLLPRIYWHFKQTSKDLIPNDIYSYLENHFINNSKHNLFLTNELLKTIDLLEKHDIKAIPFKGPTLSEFLYKNLALREFVDLDLIVKKEDVWKLREILLANSFKPYYEPLKNKQDTFLKRQCSLKFRSPNNVFFDIHWNYAQSYLNYKFDDSIWERVQLLDFHNKKINVLSKEDLFIILSINFSKDGWKTLSNIYDIAELIKSHDLDWDFILNKSVEINCKRVIALSVLLACDIDTLEIPQAILDKISSFKGLQATKDKTLKNTLKLQSHKINIIESCLFQIQLQKNLSEKLSYLYNFAIAPNERDWSFINLPKILSFLYIIIRPVRLLSKYLHKRVQKAFFTPSLNPSDH